MQTITLGRTNLQVSAAGLGCGGFSRLGLPKYGQKHAAGIVQTAFEEGVTFFDTAQGYQTQPAVGEGLAGIPRDQYVISSKFSYTDQSGRVISPEVLNQTLENALRELKTDYIDIYHIHALTAENYDETCEKLMPVLQKAKQDGKIRFLGVTELFASDTSHSMFKVALPFDLFDVIMVGYNLLNPSATVSVLPVTMDKNAGTLCMFAVRSALSNPEQLRIDVKKILENKQADPKAVSIDNALDFLMENNIASSITEAAYRFCRHTPGIDVVLTGTGDASHLKENIKSIQMPPLPDDILERLSRMFSKVDCVSGQ